MTTLSEVLADSPSGYWPFDESSGTVATDQSGGGHNGVISTPGITLHVGPYGGAGMYAYSFDGTSGRNVSISGSSIGMPTDLTVEWWSDLSSAPANSGHGCGNHWKIEIDSNGFYLYILQSTGAFWRYAHYPMASTIGGIHHFVTSFNSVSNTFTSTVDGNNLAPDATGGPTGSRYTASDTPTLVWGQYPGFASVAGSLWGCAIYSTVLSTARATAHYNQGIGVASSPMGRNVPLSRRRRLR